MLPPELRDFVLQSIDSIGHLEALLLLFRNRETNFGPNGIAQHLYIEENTARLIVRRLTQLGLSESDDDVRYRYRADASHDALVGLLDQHYARHLIAITQLIHDKSGNRIQEFARAFRLGKDK